MQLDFVDTLANNTLKELIRDLLCSHYPAQHRATNSKAERF